MPIAYLKRNKKKRVTMTTYLIVCHSELAQYRVQLDPHLKRLGNYKLSTT